MLSEDERIDYELLNQTLIQKRQNISAACVLIKRCQIAVSFQANITYLKYVQMYMSCEKYGLYVSMCA